MLRYYYYYFFFPPPFFSNPRPPPPPPPSRDFKAFFFFFFFFYREWLRRRGVGSRSIRGRDLIMWIEGQWEAGICSCDLRANERPWKKSHGKGTSDRHTHRRTCRLYDQLGPEGRVGENYFKMSILKLIIHLGSGALNDSTCLNNYFMSVTRTFRQAKIEINSYQRFSDSLLLR